MKTNIYEHTLLTLEDFVNVDNFSIKDNHSSLMEKLTDVP